MPRGKVKKDKKSNGGVSLVQVRRTKVKLCPVRCSRKENEKKEEL